MPLPGPLPQLSLQPSLRLAAQLVLSSLAATKEPLQVWCNCRHLRRRPAADPPAPKLRVHGEWPPHLLVVFCCPASACCHGQRSSDCPIPRENEFVQSLGARQRGDIAGLNSLRFRTPRLLIPLACERTGRLGLRQVTHYGKIGEEGLPQNNKKSLDSQTHSCCLFWPALWIAIRCLPAETLGPCGAQSRAKV